MIKLILTDIDGVWTDGGMYYDNCGNEFKKFNTYDGVGVKLAHDNNIKVGILTGENSNIVEYRALKLYVDYVYQGVKNKYEKYLEIIKKYNYSPNEVAYIGDDLNDIKLFNAKLGFTGCPCSCFNKDLYYQVNYVTKYGGGDGAFRDFVEYIIRNKI